MALLLRASEAAELLNCSRSKLYALLANGCVPGAIRVGRSWRVHKGILEAAIEREALADPNHLGAPTAPLDQQGAKHFHRRGPMGK